MKVKNLSHLKQLVKESEEVKSELIKDPETFLEDLDIKSPMTDKIIFKIVLFMVFGALFISMVAALITVFPIEYNTVDSSKSVIAKPIDTFFITIGSTALGALAGLLAPSPTQLNN